MAPERLLGVHFSSLYVSAYHNVERRLRSKNYFLRIQEMEITLINVTV